MYAGEDVAEPLLPYADILASRLEMAEAASYLDYPITPLDGGI